MFILFLEFISNYALVVLPKNNQGLQSDRNEVLANQVSSG